MTRAERYARTAPVKVPPERRAHVLASLRAGTIGARSWYLWQTFPDTMPADLAADLDDPNAHVHACVFARRVGLPIRRTR